MVTRCGACYMENMFIQMHSAAELVLCEGGHMTHMDFHKKQVLLVFWKENNWKMLLINTLTHITYVCYVMTPVNWLAGSATVHHYQPSKLFLLQFSLYLQLPYCTETVQILQCVYIVLIHIRPNRLHWNHFLLYQNAFLFIILISLPGPA